MEDFIPYNNLAKKTVVDGRREPVEALKEMNLLGRPPIIGHYPTAAVPQRFYVQVDGDDLSILVIPRAFQPILMQAMRIKHPRRVRLKASNWCDYSVQHQWMDNELVFFRGWTGFVRKLSMCCGDIVVFKFQIRGCFKVTVFRFDTSTQEVYRC